MCETAAHVFLTCFTRVCEVLNCVTAVTTVEVISHQANLAVHPGIVEWLIIICWYLLSAKRDRVIWYRRKKSKAWACVRDESEWAVTSETLCEFLEAYSIHHIFHFATVCTAEPVYLAGKPDLLRYHTAWQAHNKSPPKVEHKSEEVFHQSGHERGGRSTERWCSRDDRGAIRLRFWHTKKHQVFVWVWFSSFSCPDLVWKSTI